MVLPGPQRVEPDLFCGLRDSSQHLWIAAGSSIDASYSKLHLSWHIVSPFRKILQLDGDSLHSPLHYSLTSASTDLVVSPLRFDRGLLTPLFRQQTDEPSARRTMAALSVETMALYV